MATLTWQRQYLHERRRGGSRAGEEERDFESVRGSGSRKAGPVCHGSVRRATRKFSTSNAKTREPGRTIPNPRNRAASVFQLVRPLALGQAACDSIRGSGSQAMCLPDYPTHALHVHMPGDKEERPY